ncbi:MAG: glycosyltransferase, partial [Alphaproteobacteria bacterium]
SIAAFGADLVISYMSRATKHGPRGDFVHVGRLGGYYGLKYYRHCDHLVAVTPDVGRHVVDAGWPADACSVIHNFVDDRPAQALERRIHATPDAAPLIVALGRLHTNKAFDTLLRALAALPGVYLWLAGEGPEHRALESLARQLGIADRIRLLGWQTDPGPVFAAADVVVVPSRHEPLGNVMIEAWMHAKPVVATASQGPSYLLTHGETGLLSPIDDAPALARGIAEVLADPALADRLARGGRAKFERDFTERAVIGRYLDLFTRLIARRRK